MFPTSYNELPATIKKEIEDDSNCPGIKITDKVKDNIFANCNRELYDIINDGSSPTIIRDCACNEKKQSTILYHIGNLGEWHPEVLIGTAIAFVSLGYLAFRNTKKSRKK